MRPSNPWNLFWMRPCQKDKSINSHWRYFKSRCWPCRRNGYKNRCLTADDILLETIIRSNPERVLWVAGRKSSCPFVPRPSITFYKMGGSDGKNQCFDIFKIGIGPSSSPYHGDVEATLQFVEWLERECWVALALMFGYTRIFVKCRQGHGTDMAVVLGPPPPIPCL